MTPSITLKTGESRLCSMDFSALLDRGETLTSATAQVDLITAPPLVLGTPSVSGAIANVRISGGMSDTRYKITAYAVTSSSNTIQGEGFLQCRGPLNYTITPGTGSLAAVGN